MNKFILKHRNLVKCKGLLKITVIVHVKDYEILISLFFFGS